MTKTDIKQAKARLISSSIVDLIGKQNLLNKVIMLGMKDWNGSKVMVNKLEPLTIQEEEKLEADILERVNNYL